MAIGFNERFSLEKRFGCRISQDSDSHNKWFQEVARTLNQYIELINNYGPHSKLGKMYKHMGVELMQRANFINSMGYTPQPGEPKNAYPRKTQRLIQALRELGYSYSYNESDGSITCDNFNQEHEHIHSIKWDILGRIEKDIILTNTSNQTELYTIDTYQYDKSGRLCGHIRSQSDDTEERVIFTENYLYLDPQNPANYRSVHQDINNYIGYSTMSK